MKNLLILLFLSTSLAAQDCKTLILQAHRNLNKGRKLNNDSSYFYFDNALAIFEECGVDFQYVQQLNRIGEWALRNNKFQKSLPYLEKAVEMYGCLLADKGKYAQGFLGHSYNLLGECYGALGDFDKELWYYEKALSVFKKAYSEYHGLVGLTYNNLGICYQSRGEFEQQRSFHEKALQVRRKLSKTGQGWEFGQTYNHLSTYYNAIEKQEQALLENNKAIQIWERMNPKSSWIAAAYYNRGLIYSNMGNYENALKYLHQSEAIHEAQSPMHHYYPVRTLRQLGWVYGQLQQSEKQWNYYQKALTEAHQVYGEHNPETSAIYLRMGDFYNNNSDSALWYYHKGIKAVFPNYESSSLKFSADAISDENVLLRLLQRKAALITPSFKQLQTPPNNKRFLQKTKMAYQTYRQMTVLIDVLRQGEKTEQFKSEVAKNAMPIYEKAIALANALHQLTDQKIYLEQAFEFAEKSKAFLLLQGIKAMEAKKQLRLPKAMQEKEKSYLQEIGFYNNQIINTKNKIAILERRQKTACVLNNSFQYELLEQERQAAALQLDNHYTIYQVLNDSLQHFRKSTYKKHPQYEALITDTKVTTISDLQQHILSPEKALIEYFMGDSLLFVFTITATTYDLQRIPKTQKLTQDIENLRLSLGDDKTYEYAEIAYRLYQVLLEKSLSKHALHSLIIIPDGILFQIPFNVLLSRPLSNSNLRKMPYLLQTYRITYGYSATTLVNVPQKERQPTATFGVFAPSFERIFAARSLKSCGNTDLHSLEAYQTKVQVIAEIYNGDQYIGTTASKKNFLNEAQRYQMLLLFTHACANMKDPTNNQIHLNGGSLHNYELSDLKLNADLVMLSACETGVGQYVKGEGIMSLARGFSLAGCPSIVSSLWEQHPEPTQQITNHFFKLLQKGYSKSEALQKAQLMYLATANQEALHPYYWAGFVLVGEDGKIMVRKWWERKTYWIGLFLMLVGWRFYKKLRLS